MRILFSIHSNIYIFLFIEPSEKTIHIHACIYFKHTEIQMIGYSMIEYTVYDGIMRVCVCVCDTTSLVLVVIAVAIAVATTVILLSL